jgi:sugar-specific transcriptional regulator TrmB
MQVKDKTIQTLTDLGLNLSMARVYLALYETGTAKATAIAKISGVARPDVYRVLSKLHELGFVEKIIAKPSKFKSVPIENVIANLLKLKTKKLNQLEAQSKSLIRTLNNKINHKDVYPESQFVLVPSRELMIKRLKETIEKTQTSIDVSTSLKRFKFACYRLAEDLKKAWSRDVCGRVIIDATTESNLDILKSYWKSPYAKIKFVQSPPKTIMAIYDKKEVFIYIEPKADLMESPALWSNNSSVVSMAADFFEILWITAMESSEYHLDSIKP